MNAPPPTTTNPPPPPPVLPEWQAGLLAALRETDVESAAAAHRAAAATAGTNEREVVRLLRSYTGPPDDDAAATAWLLDTIDGGEEAALRSRSRAPLLASWVADHYPAERGAVVLGAADLVLDSPDEADTDTLVVAFHAVASAAHFRAAVAAGTPVVAVPRRAEVAYRLAHEHQGAELSALEANDVTPYGGDGGILVHWRPGAEERAQPPADDDAVLAALLLAEIERDGGACEAQLLLTYPTAAPLRRRLGDRHLVKFLAPLEDVFSVDEGSVVRPAPGWRRVVDAVVRRRAAEAGLGAVAAPKPGTACASCGRVYASRNALFRKHLASGSCPGAAAPDAGAAAESVRRANGADAGASRELELALEGAVVETVRKGTNADFTASVAWVISHSKVTRRLRKWLRTAAGDDAALARRAPPLSRGYWLHATKVFVEFLEARPKVFVIEAAEASAPARTLPAATRGYSAFLDLDAEAGGASSSEAAQRRRLRVSVAPGHPLPKPKAADEEAAGADERGGGGDDERDAWESTAHEPVTLLAVGRGAAIVNKPSGMRSEAAARAAAALVADGAAAGADPEYSVRTVSRLDQPVSGCLVVPLNAEAEALLTEQFKARSVSKTYLALVEGDAAETGTVDAKLRTCNDKDVNKSFVHPRGKPSLTTWKKVAALEGASLLEVSPHTGRTHQIRAHMAHAGHPLVGDGRYGRRRGGKKQRVFLHALRLELLDQAGHTLEAEAGLTEELKEVLGGYGYEYEGGVGGSGP